MDCPQTELILRLVSGELSPECGGELLRHFETCPACAAAHAELSRTWDALGDWPVDRSDIDLTERVLARVEADRTGVLSMVRWLRSMPVAVRAAACILLGVGLGMGAGRLVPVPTTGPGATRIAPAVSTEDLAETLGLDRFATGSATSLPSRFLENDAPKGGEQP